MRHFAQCHYAECRILFIVMLNVIMLSVAMQNVVMLSVIMLNAVMLSVGYPTQIMDRTISINVYNFKNIINSLFCCHLVTKMSIYIRVFQFFKSAE